jgi:mRNA interferase RelE/StbE
MTWKVKMSSHAEKALKSLDSQMKKRIEKFIDRLESDTNPRTTGKALQGEFSGLWRYRVGDYRLICEIRENELVILVLEIGHRKNIYN